MDQYLREALRDEGLKSELARLIARGQISQIRTAPLQAAYQQAINQFEAGAGMARLERALDVAYQERMRYFANRIAQTELHRTYSDQKAREFMADETVSVLQVVMSRTHPKFDICGLHAGLNKYGLGPGCYPKAEAPKPGFHPFCRCVLRPRVLTQ